MSHLSKNTDEKTIELLRARGLQVTAPRVLVLQVLATAERHLSADEIHEAVLHRHPTVNPVTIYRTLETFEAHGLAARCMLGDRVIRWEQVATPHHHLICSHCGYIVDLDDAPFQHLAAELARHNGVRLAARHLSLNGLCAICAQQTAAPE